MTYKCMCPGDVIFGVLVYISKTWFKFLLSAEDILSFVTSCKISCLCQIELLKCNLKHIPCKKKKHYDWNTNTFGQISIQYITNHHVIICYTRTQWSFTADMLKTYGNVWKSFHKTENMGKKMSQLTSIMFKSKAVNKASLGICGWPVWD